MMTVKIGLFGIGLDTYWGQFDGLLDRLKKYQDIISQKISQTGVTLINAGMVDNPEKARQAAEMMKREGVELVFLYISTYALSSTVLPVALQLNPDYAIENLNG